MPVVSDFIEIVGNGPVTIANAVFEEPFNTGGRDGDHHSFLMVNVRRLNSNVPVRVNNQVVGTLTANPSDVWSAQMISFSSGILNDGQNEFQVQSFDEETFQISNVVCFFGQGA